MIHGATLGSAHDALKGAARPLFGRAMPAAYRRLAVGGAVGEASPLTQTELS
jgi:hypothetical protein